MKKSTCPHVNTVGTNSIEDVFRKKAKQECCEGCGAKVANLWLCLHHKCLYVGCGEANHDHSQMHSEELQHCLTINMTTMRVWCYNCESEVYRDANEPPVFRNTGTSNSGSTSSAAAGRVAGELGFLDTDDSEEDDTSNIRPRGLTGLYNIGNTCYMNAALQCLSNCPPLIRFFLDCDGFIDNNPQPNNLSKYYQRLVTEMWHKKRLSYVSPTKIAHGIKHLHPMFRGYTQQDSQEFLRCFMDDIHEELKQIVPPSELPSEDESESDTESADSRPDRSHDSLSSGDISGYGSRETVAPITSSLAGSSAALSNLTNSSTFNRQSSSATSAMTPTYDGNTVSDTEYETCDSGNGSDSGSTDSRMNSTDIEPQVHNVRVAKKPSSASSGYSSVNALSRESTLTAKQKKDVANQASKQATNAVGPAPLGSSLTNDVASEADSDGATVALRGKQNNQHSKSPEVDTYSDALSDIDTAQQKQSRSKASNKQREQQQTSTGTGVPSTPTSPPASTRKKHHTYQSVISDVFDGKINSSVQCLTCERVSSTRETFQDLSLPIPSKDHLHVLHSTQSSISGGVGGSSASVVGATQQTTLHSGNAVSPATSSSGATAVGGTPSTSAASSAHHKGTCGEVTLKQTWFAWMFGWMKSWLTGPMITLQDCLAAFFSADELKGDNMYSCDKCKKLRNGVKFSKVLELPEVLCIHLKRFRHEFMYSSKISSYVSFPLEGLDMTPYTHEKCTDKVRVYDLVSVICHHGTAGGGHYTSYGLNNTNLQWYEFDDQCVTEVDMQTVENCEAYVLFYRKRNEGMLKLRQQADELMKSPETSMMKFFISKQWINRFNTFAEPGPITNYDFLCRHGGVGQHHLTNINKMVLQISSKLWQHLHREFGGGPAVNHIYPCATCQQEKEALMARQKHEKETFMQLYDNFRSDNNPAIYAIALLWFKQWESFVNDKTQDPPGPIDNQRICASPSSAAVPVLKPTAAYGQISEEMWTFLYEIYSGGPEMILKPRETTLLQQQQQLHNKHEDGSYTKNTDASSVQSETSATTADECASGSKGDSSTCHKRCALSDTSSTDTHSDNPSPTITPSDTSDNAPMETLPSKGGNDDSSEYKCHVRDCRDVENKDDARDQENVDAANSTDMVPPHDGNVERV